MPGRKRNLMNFISIMFHACEQQQCFGKTCHCSLTVFFVVDLKSRFMFYTQSLPSIGTRHGKLTKQAISNKKKKILPYDEMKN
jgi:hypothetical protein